MTQALEGTWEEVRQQLERLPFDKAERVRVVVAGNTSGSEDTSQLKTPKRLTLGMFPELANLTEEDFKSAEYHGDPEDDLS